jgi:hypothetical protein
MLSEADPSVLGVEVEELDQPEVSGANRARPLHRGMLGFHPGWSRHAAWRYTKVA